MTDYLANLNVTLVPEQANTRLLYPRRDLNVLFVGQEPADVRRLVNAGMEAAVAHYAANVAQSAVTFTPQQIEEVSLHVVCATVYIYALWRGNGTNPEQPLDFTQEDLEHPQSQDQCLWYCRDVFKTKYAVYAAALLGMTADEFTRYETSRERFWNR